MADPGFPRRGGGGNPCIWAEHLLFENCMKMKELDRGARVPGPPIDPLMVMYNITPMKINEMSD